jgi:hypothetical protein
MFDTIQSGTLTASRSRPRNKNVRRRKEGWSPGIFLNVTDESVGLLSVLRLFLSSLRVFSCISLPHIFLNIISSLLPFLSFLASYLSIFLPFLFYSLPCYFLFFIFSVSHSCILPLFWHFWPAFFHLSPSTFPSLFHSSLLFSLFCIFIYLCIYLSKNIYWFPSVFLPPFILIHVRHSLFFSPHPSLFY